MSDFQYLRREIAEGVATFTLACPEVMNAVPPETIDECPSSEHLAQLAA